MKSQAKPADLGLSLLLQGDQSPVSSFTQHVNWCQSSLTHFGWNGSQALFKSCFARRAALSLQFLMDPSIKASVWPGAPGQHWLQPRRTSSIFRAQPTAWGHNTFAPPCALTLGMCVGSPSLLLRHLPSSACWPTPSHQTTPTSWWSPPPSALVCRTPQTRQRTYTHTYSIFAAISRNYALLAHVTAYKVKVGNHFLDI